MPKFFKETDAFRVLLIEDDLDHAELIRRTLHEHPSHHEILHLIDGEEARDFILQISYNTNSTMNNKPHIILLDLRLPKITGHEILSIVKASSLQFIPVIVLTTSKAPEDLKQAYLGHANSYLVKPQNFESFSTLVELIGTYWLDWNSQFLNTPA